MPYLGVPQPTFGVARRRFRSRPIASQSRDTSVASDASTEMPGNESSNNGGTKVAANDLSNVERDARILEVKLKERELILKHRIEVGEEEFAEAQRQLERRRRDKENEFAEVRRRFER